MSDHTDLIKRLRDSASIAPQDAIKREAAAALEEAGKREEWLVKLLRSSLADDPAAGEEVEDD